jgi:hypothetical protein
MLRSHRTRTSPSQAGRSLPLLAIAVIGGDARQCAAHTDAATIRLFSSSNDGGNGRLRAALAAIRRGSFDVVVLLRWLGHSDSQVMVSACAAAAIPARVVSGGMTAARSVGALNSVVLSGVLRVP